MSVVCPSDEQARNAITFRRAKRNFLVRLACPEHTPRVRGLSVVLVVFSFATLEEIERNSGKRGPWKVAPITALSYVCCNGTKSGSSQKGHSSHAISRLWLGRFSGGQHLLLVPILPTRAGGEEPDIARAGSLHVVGDCVSGSGLSHHIRRALNASRGTREPVHSIPVHDVVQKLQDRPISHSRDQSVLIAYQFAAYYFRSSPTDVSVVCRVCSFRAGILHRDRGSRPCLHGGASVFRFRTCLVEA